MKPSILIPVNIRNKIQFIVDNCDKEVSGLGTVVFDKAKNAYRVTEIILLDQEVGSAHTDIDDEAVAQAMYDMRDCEGELAFWWHSHVNMSTFWSGTDHETMEAIGKNGLCVAVVFNKKEEMRGAIVMAPEGFPASKLDDVKIEVEHTYDFDTVALLAEMKEKVREKVWTPATHTYYSSHTNILKSTDDHTNNPISTVDAVRKQARDQWSRLSKEQRQRYTDFEDFSEEFMWGEYDTNTHLMAGMY